MGMSEADYAATIKRLTEHQNPCDATPASKGSGDKGGKVKSRSRGEEEFLQHIHLLGLPAPVEEYRFHPPRRWRFDFAWPSIMLAVEIEGGTWTQGRHTRGAGFRKDCEKYNTAVLDGWRVLRFTTEQVTDGTAQEMVHLMIKGAE